MEWASHLDVPVTRENLDTDMHIGRMPCEPEDTVQVTPLVKESQRLQHNQISLAALPRNQPYQQLDLELQASRNKTVSFGCKHSAGGAMSWWPEWTGRKARAGLSCDLLSQPIRLI